MTQYPREALNRQVFFQQQEKSVGQPPDDESPRCPVPQPTQQEHHNLVHHRPRTAQSVATQRNIKVFLKPGGQRAVPTAPKLPDRLGHVGVDKVFAIVKTKHTSHADGHVGITGKVEVNLEHERQRRQPRGSRIDFGAGRVVNRVRHHRQRVGDDDFL